MRLEFLDGVGIRQRHIVQNGQIHVVRVDTFQLEIVVGGTLSVDVNRHLPASKCGGVKELGVGARGQSEKRQKIPRGEWESAGRLGANRLTGACRGEFYGERHIFYRNGFSNLTDSKGGGYIRDFRHPNKDVLNNKPGKSRCRDFYTVAAGRQAWNVERPCGSA